MHGSITSNNHCKAQEIQFASLFIIILIIIITIIIIMVKIVINIITITITIHLLLNHFTRRCSWVGMIIKVDKCSTFGMKKAYTSSVQYLSKLLIYKSVVPAVEKGKSFRYLGRFFKYFMDNSIPDPLDVANHLVCKINDLPFHPKNKLPLYHRFVRSKISWNLTIADISQIYTVENLDNIVSNYIPSWLELPISATLSNLVLTRSKLGMTLVLPSSKFIQCQTTLRNTLKSFPNIAITNRWKDTSHHTNIQCDQVRNTRDALKAVKSKHENRLSTN